MLTLSFLLLALFLIAPQCSVDQPVGYGAAATGGQGHPVVLVTTRADMS
jgi:hypothetical protein